MSARFLLPLASLALLSGAVLHAQAIPLATVNSEMAAAANGNPSICQLVDLNATFGGPLSHQGRTTFGVKISDNVGQDEDEPTFLLVATYHGNEFGTPYVALYAMFQLLGGYGVDPTITALVDEYEIWIVPVWNVDGYPTSRNNRNPAGSVDLNRNYPFLWNVCNSGTRGVAPASEPETQLMLAMSEQVRFTKVLDFHSSGRESLYGYRQQTGCPTYVLQNFIRNEAITLSQNSSYGGSVRGPSSNGEHYQWQLGRYSNLAFLTEISNTQSPTTASAQMEASRVWPGTVWMLGRSIPVSGHVYDGNTGLPVEANISYVENPFTQGETNPSEPMFGRYHAWLPNGNHTLRFEHPCYETLDVPVTVTSAGVEIDVTLQPRCAACAERNGSGVNPTGFDCVTPPQLGTDWDLSVATNGSTLSTLVAFSGAPAQTPYFGTEILVDLSVVVFLPGSGSYSIAIANNAAFIGAPVYTQGFRIDNVGGMPTLVPLNAQDATVGIAAP